MFNNNRFIRANFYVFFIVSMLGLVELFHIINPVKVVSLSGRASNIESWIETKRDSRIRQIEYQTGYLTFYLDGDFNHKFIYQLNIGGRITTATLDYLKRNILGASRIEIQFDERSSRDSEIYVSELLINDNRILPTSPDSYLFNVIGIILFLISGSILLRHYKFRRA